MSSGAGEPLRSRPGTPRASPSDPPRQAPNGVGCGQRDSHEHERPVASASRSALPGDQRSPPVHMASADFSTASSALSDTTVPYYPANQHGRGIWNTRRDLPRIRPATFLAHPPRLRDGPLMDIGLRHDLLARPDRPRLIRAAQRGPNSPAAPCVPRIAISPPASFPPRLTATQLPSTCGWCHQPPQGTHTPELLVMLSAPTGVELGHASSIPALLKPSATALPELNYRQS